VTHAREEVPRQNPDAQAQPRATREPRQLPLQLQLRPSGRQQDEAVADLREAVQMVIDEDGIPEEA
jgi:hypothetical protein